jgi:hypothetical protein
MSSKSCSLGRELSVFLSASGYGRRGSRLPRLRFKTVRETFTSHGSSQIRRLSRAPPAIVSRLFIVAMSVK